jgi:hypothetical protein
MNKYNVQAIRKELEECIRNSRWKSFRNRFQNLDADLARAVAVYNASSSKKHNNKKQQRSSSCSLLRHMLTYCRPQRHNNNGVVPIPMDVLELVIRASPSNALRTSPTPLAIALEHGASLILLETILSSSSYYDDNDDDNNNTEAAVLYVSDQKHGDTPLLYAIRHGLDEVIVRLLIRSDPTRQSLLLSSSRKNGRNNHRTPLFYAANRELSYLRKEDVDLPFDLQYMLLQSHLAIMKNTDRHHCSKDNAATTETEETDKALCIPKPSSSGFFDDDGYDDDDDDDESSIDYNVSEKEHWTTLLEATIATAHLLGTKSTAKILAFLVPKTTLIAQHRPTDAYSFCTTNTNTSTLLHHVCRATEEQSFLEPNIPITTTLSSSDATTSLVDALLVHDTTAGRPRATSPAFGVGNE